MEQASPARGAERRENPRKTITRPAVLNHARLGPHAGWITDVSLEGAFVRSDWGDLPTFTAVEVLVTLESGEEHKVKEYRLPATVARSTEDGIGVRFGNLDMESYSALLELLYSN
jgi:hypothetical protein